MILDLVEERVGCLELPNIQEYLERFSKSEFHEQEYEFWASHLTVNETYFFRNEGDWNALRSTILPEMMELRREERRLRILCLGASSGEEPYTIALMLKNEFPELRGWDVQIHATDIHRQLIKKANEGGPYSSRSVKFIPESMKERDLYYDGQGWYVSEELRSMVVYTYANLFSMPISIKVGTYDVVFCRNVVIYFTKEIASNLVKTIFGYLRQGGYLILGHSEGSIADDAGLKPAQLPGSLAYKNAAGMNGSMQHRKPQHDESLLATAGVMQPRNGAIAAQTWVSTQTLVERAKRLIEDGDLEQAGKELQTVLLREPFHTDAHYYMGIIYQNIGELGKALFEFEKVTRLNPDFVMGYFQAAMLCQRVRNYTHARMYYNALYNLLNKFEPETVLEGSADITAGFARIICQRFLNNHS